MLSIARLLYLIAELALPAVALSPPVSDRRRFRTKDRRRSKGRWRGAPQVTPNPSLNRNEPQSQPRSRCAVPVRFRDPRPPVFDWFLKRSLANDWFLLQPMQNTTPADLDPVAQTERHAVVQSVP